MYVYSRITAFASHLNSRSAYRLFLSLRTNCSKASSPIISDVNAKVIYSFAPAMGHNMGHWGEVNLRVLYIVHELERAKLTPEWRETEIGQVLNIRSATMEDITSVHSKSYLFSLEKAVEHAKASNNGVNQIEDSGHTYVTATTYKNALTAVGAGLSLVDFVVAASKINENPPVGFALIRPPGHHALPELAMGCCIFNNVAIAARYVQRIHGLKRVFIIDFDLHHGNGTNDAFYDDPDIFFLSTHVQAGYPPHTGKFDDIGCGDGEGMTINVPLPAGSGDTAMATVFDEIIVPSAQRFKPDIILVSAGYNGHTLEILDPNLKKNPNLKKKFLLTTGSYYMLASGIKQLAKDLCGGRCVFFLEGGTDMDALPFSIAESFRAFIGEPSIAPNFTERYHSQLKDEASCEEVKQAIERVKSLHSL